MNKKNCYKIETTNKGIEVYQIIDGWLFTTVVPSTIPIIIREEKRSDNNET